MHKCINIKTYIKKLTHIKSEQNTEITRKKKK